MWSYDKTCNSEYSDLGTVKCSSQNNHERIKHCSPQVFTVGSSSPNQRKEQLIRQYLYLLSIEFLSSSEHIAFWTTFTSKLMDMNLEEFKSPINQLLYFYFFFRQNYKNIEYYNEHPWSFMNDERTTLKLEQQKAPWVLVDSNRQPHWLDSYHLPKCNKPN